MPNQYVVNACFELAKKNSSDENSKREQLHIARHLYAKIEPLVTNLKQTEDCRRLVEAINSLFHLIPRLQRKHKNNYMNVTDEILEMVKIPMRHVTRSELQLTEQTQNRIVTFHIFFVVCARLEYKVEVSSSMSSVEEFVNEWATSPHLYDLSRTAPLVDLVPLSFVYALLSVWRIWTQERQTSSQRIKLGALFEYTWKIVCGDTDADNLNQPLARILEHKKGFPPCIFGAIDFLMYAPEAFFHEHNLEAEDCLKRYMSLLASTRFKDRAQEGVTAECSLSRWTVESHTRGANKSGALRATRQSMLTVLLGTEVWDFVIDPLFTPTDKALLRMTCECMRDRYREFVSLQAPETLSATPSLFRFTVGTDPRHFDFDWLRVRERARRVSIELKKSRCTTDHACEHFLRFLVGMHASYLKTPNKK
eukprot:gene315-573_t